MSACLLSPGPLTTQPMTATVRVFDAGVAFPPFRHPLVDVRLDVLGHFLEKGAGGSAAAGTRGHLGDKLADAQGLQNLLGDPHFLGPVSSGLRG